MTRLNHVGRNGLSNVLVKNQTKKTIIWFAPNYSDTGISDLVLVMISIFI